MDKRKGKGNERKEGGEERGKNTGEGINDERGEGRERGRKDWREGELAEGELERGRMEENEQEAFSGCVGQERVSSKDCSQPCPALSGHQGRHERGEAKWGGAGQAVLASCLTPSLLPPLAAMVGSQPPATLSPGNHGELSGAVSPAASPKRGDSNASLPWASGPTASPVKAVGEGLAAGEMPTF